MLKKIHIKLFFYLSLIVISNTKLFSQSNIKYGPDYIVFEAEDTPTALSNYWTIREPGDTEYLKYLTNVGSSPDPINETYLEYTGPWQGDGSNLTYTFTCKKTGTYQVAMRMHCPLRDGESADQRNDVFIKMEGNFTSASPNLTTTDLKTLHKFFGRGANKWGTCINLEHNGNNGVLYNLIEGEEYFFTMKGRSNGASFDYIAFYDTSYLTHNINNQGPDLALQLPEEIRPYLPPTNIELSPNPSDLRVGTSLQLETIVTPSNGNPTAVWSSSNDSIVSVDQNGYITAEGTEGQTATITAISIIDNSLITTSDITLVAYYPVAVSTVVVSPNQITILEGEMEELSATIFPSIADNKIIIWSSSNPNIANVDQNGIVTGVSEGSVQIRATSDENNAIFDEATVDVGEPTPQFATINKINGMSVADFKTSRSNQIEIGEILTMEVSYSGITEFNGTGYGRVVIRYAINNGGTAVSPNLNINNIPVDATEITETVNYTVADHGTTNNSEPAVLQIFAAQNFAGINSLYTGFEVVPAGSLSTPDKLLNNEIILYPNPAKDFVTVEKPNFNSKLNVDIYNIAGVLVKTEILGSKRQEISTHQFQPGVYIIQFKKDTTVATRKLIIQ